MTAQHGTIAITAILLKDGTVIGCIGKHGLAVIAVSHDITVFALAIHQAVGSLMATRRYGIACWLGERHVQSVCTGKANLRAKCEQRYPYLFFYSCLYCKAWTTTLIILPK